MGSLKITDQGVRPLLLRGSLISLALMVGLPACSESPTVDQPAANVETAPDELAPLAEVTGERLSFKGRFVEAVGDSLFRVEATDLESEGLQAAGEILVINQAERSYRLPADEATPLWILGNVQTLTAADLADNNVPPERRSELEGQPVVVANSLTLAPDPETLVDNADAFLNQPVTVFGTIQSTDDPKMLILENPGLFQAKGVMVIASADAELSKAIDDQRAAVSGVLRPYVVADLEKEYDLTWNLSLQEELEAEFQQSPVVIATGVYPLGEAGE